MRDWPGQCVDLIYLDPPFNSKANYNQTFGKGNGVPAQVRAFTDTWIWGEAASERVEQLKRAVNHPAHKVICGLEAIMGECGMLAYLSYMAERLAEMKRLLKSTGSIYLHCDPSASHYLKLLMDAIFGADNFRNEIVWQRYGSHNDARKYGRVTDTLLYYAGANATWTTPRLQLSETDIAARYTNKDDRGPYTTSPLHARTLSGGGYRYEWKGIVDVWKFPKERLDELDIQGRIHWPKRGRVPRRKVYLADNPGKPLSNLWADISIATGKERLDYPTQKPVALLDRIIKASSNLGDLVLDPFCGGGTTLDAAARRGRKWVGIDISPRAIDLVKDRRFKDSTIPTHGIPADMESAKMMLARNPFDFEAWAVTRIEGLAPNQVQVGDGGIDGRGRIFDPVEGETGLVIAQVKGGGYSATALRDFQHVMDREKATAGVFITLNKTTVKPAMAKAAQMGTYKIGASSFPRLQFWSIEEHMAESRTSPALPPMADPNTGKAMQQDLFRNP